MTFITQYHSLTKVNSLSKMRDLGAANVDIESILQPETVLEKKIINHSKFQEGLFWGKPRYGHPEGKVILHIREVLDNVEALNIDDLNRARLRLITLVHDTFKFEEDTSYPRDWSKHHGVLGRKFLEAFTTDQAVLDVVELHDEAFYSWRLIKLYCKKESGQERLEKLLNRLGDNIQLFYLFFKCDTQTGDKIQAPLKWFEETVEKIEVVL